MNTTPETGSVWQRSPVARFCRWFCSWRGVRRLLIVLAWAVTLVALFYAEENWRGGRAWDNYRRQLPRGGAELSLHGYVPKPVPDNQNFASIPFIKDWFIKRTHEESERRWPDDFARANLLVPAVKPKTEPARRAFVDLVAWEKAFAAAATNATDKVTPGALDTASRAAAAPAVLEALKTDDAVFSEMRAAANRPFAVYPVQYDVEIPMGILLAHLPNVRAGCERLQLKGSAELVLGQTDQALQDVELMLRLVDPLKQEPSLISHLVRIAGFRMAAQTLWEGLAEHRWSEPQLNKLRASFSEFGFLSEFQTAFGGERACVLDTIDYIRRHGRPTMIAGPSDTLPYASVCDAIALLTPRGWYRKEQLNYALACDMTLTGAVDVASRRVWPSRLKANEDVVDKWLKRGTRGPVGRYFHHQVAVSVLAPSWRKLMLRIAAAQNTAKQVAIACALEQYRLAHGEYPEKLDVLQPATGSKLLVDIITGQALRYKRDGKDGYVLYSVGWDQKDDGGVPGKTVDTSETGDWVWQIPERQNNPP